MMGTLNDGIDASVLRIRRRGSLSLAALAASIALAGPVVGLARAAALPASGALSAHVRARFKSNAGYTTILALTVEDVPAGASVHVTCAGQGCPYGAMSFLATRDEAINLQPGFGQRHLRVGDRITITIDDQGASRRYAYVFRAHRNPVAHEASLSSAGDARELGSSR